MFRGLGAVAAAVALVTTPMAASAGCWDADETSAATVRELQSVLMVAALRCQAAGNGFINDYNGFLRANRTTIQQMNDRIKAHFVKGAGPVHGLIAYDAFATSLANGHGAEGASVEICSGMGVLAREATLVAGSAEGLLLLAARQGLTISLAEGTCTRAPMMALSTPPAAALAAATVTAAPSAVAALIAAAPDAADRAPLPAALAMVEPGYGPALASYEVSPR